MLRIVARRLRQGVFCAVVLAPAVANAAPFPPDSLLTVDLAGIPNSCRLLPAPMEGDCEGMDSSTGAQLATKIQAEAKGVVMHGVVLVRRPTGSHVVTLIEYPNVGYAAKLDDVERLADQFVRGAGQGASAPSADLRDGGASLGTIAAIRFSRPMNGQPASLGYFAFLGDPNIQVMEITTLGDPSTGPAFADELLATARLSPEYKPRSLTATAPVDLSAPLGKLTAWIVIAGLVIWPWWHVRQKRRRSAP